MSVLVPARPHACAPRDPARIAGAISAGYREVAHVGGLAAATARADALGRLGIRPLVEPAEHGYLVLARDPRADGAPTPPMTTVRSSRQANRVA